MAEQFQEEQGKAAFNTGLSITERINNFQLMLETALIQWNLRLSLDIIQTLESEVDYWLASGDREIIKNIVKEIIDLQTSHPQVLDMDYANDKDAPTEARAKMKGFLILYNRFIRRCIQENGLGMPPKDESGLF